MKILLNYHQLSAYIYLYLKSYFSIVHRDLENGDIGFSDVELNLKLLNKYFEVNTLDETLLRRRNEFKTRSEHLQKRKEALHDREIMLKERILR
jgi:hypothetical protein